jgi:hypothetical protein
MPYSTWFKICKCVEVGLLNLYWMHFFPLQALCSQVLHTTVVKQLEIAKLLDNLRESKCRVSSSVIIWLNSIVNFINEEYLSLSGINIQALHED